MSVCLGWSLQVAIAVEVEVWRPEWGECEPVCTWTLTREHNDHTSGNYSEINTDRKKLKRRKKTIILNDGLPGGPAAAGGQEAGQAGRHLHGRRHSILWLR